MNLDAKIEAILFFRGEPIKLKKLAEFLDVKIPELDKGVNVLEERLKISGLSLVRNGDEIMLGTKAEVGGIIEKITKEELTRDLGKAGLETISIILYKNPISRREIDFIRGVNSSFILRNLLIRGLIERGEQNEAGGRGYHYKPTFELLGFMGLTNTTELPEHAVVLQELEEFSRNEKEKINEEVTPPIE
jgi:segregation and condensation protein B